MIIISFLAIWGAVHERGPFLGPDPLRSVLSLQLFLIFAATPFIFLAVLAEEREEAQEALSGVSRKLIEAHEQERTLIARRCLPTPRYAFPPSREGEQRLEK